MDNEKEGVREKQHLNRGEFLIYICAPLVSHHGSARDPHPAAAKARERGESDRDLPHQGHRHEWLQIHLLFGL